MINMYLIYFIRIVLGIPQGREIYLPFDFLPVIPLKASLLIVSKSRNVTLGHVIPRLESSPSTYFAIFITLGFLFWLCSFSIHS